MVPMISSTASGISGSGADDAARKITVRLPLCERSRSAPSSPRSAGGVEDERDDDADQGQRLGQREPDVHIRADQPGRLRLTGHGLDAMTEDQADADAGPDGREAVGDRPEVDDQRGRGAGGGRKMCEVKHVCIPLRSCRRNSPGGFVGGNPVGGTPAVSGPPGRLLPQSWACAGREPSQWPASSEPPMYCAVRMVKM